MGQRRGRERKNDEGVGKVSGGTPPPPPAPLSPGPAAPPPPPIDTGSRTQRGAGGGEGPAPFVVLGPQRIVGPNAGRRRAEPRVGGVSEGGPKDALAGTEKPRQAEEGTPFVSEQHDVPRHRGIQSLSSPTARRRRHGDGKDALPARVEVTSGAALQSLPVRISTLRAQIQTTSGAAFQPLPLQLHARLRYSLQAPSRLSSVLTSRTTPHSLPV